jgi:uncharacterized protein YehS (DUF1456 family)
MLRDDQIVEILELVDFRITKSELGAFPWRKMKTIWNVVTKLRNFLNAVIHLRGTKENQKTKWCFSKT